MAATRLTKSLRDEIHNALMERAYVDRKDEVARMEHDLGMAVYNDKYSPAVQTLMKQFPDDFFEQHRAIYVAFNDDYYHLSLQQSVPAGNQHTRWRAMDNYPEEHELTDAFKKFRKAKEEYENDRDRLSAESVAILQGCSTVKKLLETWPEIKPVLEKLGIQSVQSEEVRLPAIIQDMNALFRLEPDDVEGDKNLALAA